MNTPECTGEDALEVNDNRAAEELIAKLRCMKDPDAEIIHGHPRIKTVAQLIQAIEDRTPDGMRFVRLDLEVKELQLGVKSEQGVAKRLKQKILEVLKLK